jgi:hypothetical protein
MVRFNAAQFTCLFDIIVINQYNDRYGKGRVGYAAQAKASFFSLFILGHEQKGF